MSTTGRASRGSRVSRRHASPLAPRAVRMRNACVRHAADRLGLEPPADEDLRALGDDTSLREAVAWWQARAVGAAALPAPEPARVPFAVRAAVATAVTVLGLALSVGRAH